MGVLGETLQQARHARGVSQAKAAEETRVPLRYIKALEEEDLAALPAPIFTRGFLRIYAQYLGLSPDEVTSLYADREKAEPEMEPLPELPPVGGIKPLNWVVGGAALVLLFLVLVAVYRMGSDDETPGAPERAASLPTQTVRTGDDIISGTSATGGLIAPVAEGTVPDFRGANLALARSVLSEMGISYIVIGLANPDVPAGVVYEQSPPSGTTISETTTITLLVSRTGE